MPGVAFGLTDSIQQAHGLGDSTGTTSVGERRAALGRPRTPEPVSVAATRTSPTPADAAPATEPAQSTAAPAQSATTHADAPQARISRPVRRAAVARPANRPASTKRPSGAAAATRRRTTIPALSFFAVFGLVGGSLLTPLGGADIATAAVVVAPPLKPVGPTQQYTAHGTYGTAAVDRDGYDITKPAPVVVAPAVTATDSAAADSTSGAAVAATPDPGSAKAIALQMVTARGWGTDQYSCLVSLWNKESGWNVAAYNPSGAYGIPQSLPGSKMASAGADWKTNPATQITWGLNYITGVYGTPCGAWGHSVANNWY